MSTIMPRRSVFAVAAGILASFTTVGRSSAQFTEQEVRNGLQVTSTGDVEVDQAASGSQSVVILDDGSQVTDDGVYRTGTSQTVVNDGQITSTGTVRVSQSASGNQEVSTLPSSLYDGARARICSTGAVMSDPNGVLYFQQADCCWYAVPCCAERKCRGDRCGS